MRRQSHRDWYAHVSKLKADLGEAEDDLGLAQRFWHAISGASGYDARDGNRLVSTFRACALKSDEGLAVMLYAFRTLAEDTGEFPRAELFDPPLENLLRMICRHTNHPLNSDAIWIVGFLDDDR